MDEDQIHVLAQYCKSAQVFWQDSGGEIRRIVDVSVTPVDLEKDGMPVPVAFLEKGYIDLENVDPRSFLVARSLFG